MSASSFSKSLFLPYVLNGGTTGITVQHNRPLGIQHTPNIQSDAIQLFIHYKLKIHIKSITSHSLEGHTPCRLQKLISVGQYPITNTNKKNLSCNKTIAITMRRYTDKIAREAINPSMLATYDKSWIIFKQYRQVNKLIMKGARASQTRILNAVGIQYK